MYPAQTSLIPVQIALARFLEERLGDLGPPAGGLGNYPFWYLGTTPFRYLTGPILPTLLIFAHKIFPHLSLFEIFWGVLMAFWVFGGFGVYWLVRELRNQGDKGDRRDRGGEILAAVFYLFGPIVPLLFRFSNGLSLMSFSLVPWALLGYLRFLRREDRGEKGDRGNRGFKGTWVRRPADWGFWGLTTLVLLLDTSVLPTLFLGMVAIFLSTTSWKKAEKKVRSSLVLLFFSFLVVTVWYTPGYWWELLMAPSFAGKPLFKVIGQLSQLLPAILAITLAVISGRFFKPKPKVKSSLLITDYSSLKFCFYWLFIFGCLTLLRFVADPDFWLDWTAYGVELQMGVGILGGLVVGRLSNAPKYQISNIKYPRPRRGEAEGGQNDTLKLKNFCLLLCSFTFYFLLFTFIFDHYVLGTFQKDITQSVEYQIGEWLDNKVKKGERVFLSGTTVFWLNAFFDVWQVKGGKDEVSVYPGWREAAWEIREGKEAEKSIRVLQELGVSYLVVHAKESREFWHDFAHPEKFEGLAGLEKIYEEKGDRIYRETLMVETAP